MPGINMQKFWQRGEHYIWFTALSLVSILMIAGVLMWVVISNGIGVFWIDNMYLFKLKNGNQLIGTITQDQEFKSDSSKDRYQLKIGNRDLYGLDFRWILKNEIEEKKCLENISVVERLEYGQFFGFLKSIESGIGDKSLNVYQQFDQTMTQVKNILSQKEKIDQKIFQINLHRETLELKKKKLLYDETRQHHSEIQNLDYQISQTENQFHELLTKSAHFQNEVNPISAIFEDANGQIIKIQFYKIVRHYLPNQMSLSEKSVHYISKIWELLWDEPREANTEGGLFPAIFGTILLVFFMSIISFPFGVLAGVYLSEYATDNLFVRLIRIAVNNLAGIPSIVFGIFGLGFFIYIVGGSIDQIFFPERLPTPTFGTGGILWASATLALLTLPIVIVSTEESLRTIPRGVRQSSLALGATKIQTIVRLLIPMGSPGILTGFILSMARAAGEVAPLMITGVVKLAPTLPIDGQFPYFHLNRKFMHLGFHIYDVGFQSPNVESAKPMVFITTFLLVGIVVAMSSVAIYYRNKMKEKYTIRSL